MAPFYSATMVYFYSALDRNVFRGKFTAELRNAFDRGELQFHGSLLHLAQPRAFAAWLRVLFRHHWVVYSKKPFGGPEYVLRYLGAPTPIASPSPTPGWSLSPTATSPSAGTIPPTATRSAS